ncbi:hypothetical protein, partial [Nitrosomonas communis]|uniref:hypothetical protein n=1 Tax=Nitrosomonas communis TaxID=44574 RepID=UPI003D2DAECD
MTKKNMQELPNDGNKMIYSAQTFDPMLVPKPLMVEDIVGNMDGCEATGIYGWAFNKSDADEYLEIEILVDGQLIARQSADKYREDLLVAGIGNGRHGFRIQPPVELFDGNEHLIEVRETATGQVLPNSPRTFKAVLFKSEDIRLDGGELVGSLRLPVHTSPTLYLKVMEGSTVIGDGWSTPDSEAFNKAHFRVSLPVTVFDGRPHSFSVRSDNPAMHLGDLAIITPYMLTPESALQRYAREGLRPGLSTMAGFRYESLINAIAQFADEATNSADEKNGSVRGKKANQEVGARKLLAEQLRQISYAHAQLVRGFNEKDKIFKPLVFPSIENPCVSIVIPVHNKFPVTYHCLLSLLLAPNRAS